MANKPTPRPASPKPAQTITVVRDSRNGQFVKPIEATRRPATTETERYRRKK